MAVVQPQANGAFAVRPFPCPTALPSPYAEGKQACARLTGSTTAGEQR